MKLNYKILTILIIFLIPFVSAKVNNEESIRGLKGYETQKIDAKKNARTHSNLGNLYFEEKNYLAALKEYEIAYNLDNVSSNSSVYLYNIARCYIEVGNYTLAKRAIKGAINKDCINIIYYNTLAECIVNLGNYMSEFYNYLHDTTNPYNRIIAGLILVKIGEKTNAKILFDDFINSYPDMLITDDVKRILKNL